MFTVNCQNPVSANKAFGLFAMNKSENILHRMFCAHQHGIINECRIVGRTQQIVQFEERIVQLELLIFESAPKSRRDNLVDNFFAQ
jgi:hypothetical protein